MYLRKTAEGVKMGCYFFFMLVVDLFSPWAQYQLYV